MLLHLPISMEENRKAQVILGAHISVISQVLIHESISNSIPWGFLGYVTPIGNLLLSLQPVVGTVPISGSCCHSSHLDETLRSPHMKHLPLACLTGTVFCIHAR